MKRSATKPDYKNIDIYAEARSFNYLLSLLPAILVVTGNVAGGYFTLLNCLLAALLLPLADWLLPAKVQKPKLTLSIIPDTILILAVLCHTLAVASLIFGIYSGRISGSWIWVAAVSTGFSSGILGINSAHELIHRKQKWMQNLGIWNLFLVNYTHFYIEHRLGHHVHVGTQDDPATARYNESFYHFLFRTVPAQWKSAFYIEARRLAKYGKQPCSLQNFVISAWVCQVIFIAVLGQLLSLYVVWAYLLQSVLAIYVLEFVNYIEHYGLSRQKGERVSVHHSWQSDAVSSRFTLFELSRHTDHHIKAYKPYYQLESHQESYVLPSGYFGLFYAGMIPPLWFKLINPIIKQAEGQSHKIS